MDLVMPVLDGFETIRRIRQDPNLREVVIIATSASILHHEQVLSYQAGCNAFLTKPIDLEHLLKLIETHLQVQWIYEQINPTTLIHQETVNQDLEEEHPGLPSSSLVIPPPDELTPLLELAKQGNIARILDQVDKLEQLDARYLPFARRLRQLGESFQERKIREFIEESIETQNK